MGQGGWCDSWFTNEWCSSSTLNGAIDNRSVSASSPATPCHGTSTLNNASVTLSRASRCGQPAVAPRFPATALGEERPHRFHHQPAVASATCPRLHGRRFTGLGSNAPIRQHAHLVGNVRDAWVHHGVIHVGGRTVPDHHQPVLLHQRGSCDAHHPALRGRAGAPDLPRAWAFTHRMDAFHATPAATSTVVGSANTESAHARCAANKRNSPVRAGSGGKHGVIVAREPTPVRAHTTASVTSSLGYKGAGDVSAQRAWW